MFCTKCGKQLPDDLKVCPDCGATVENDASNPSAENAQPTPKKKKKRLGLILGIVIPVVLVLALAISAATYFLFFKEDEQVLSVIDAYIDDAGVAYICYGDGTLVKISGDIEEACMTPDRSKVIVVEKKGDVYWVDVKDNERHTFAENNEDKLYSYTVLTDRYIAYSIEDTKKDKTEYFRYEFATETGVSIASVKDDEMIDIVYSDPYATDDLSVAVAFNKKVDVLSSGEDSIVTATTYSDKDNLSLVGISSDGSSVIWSKVDDGKYSVVIYRDGNEDTLLSGDVVIPNITEDNYQQYLAQYLEDTYDESKYESVDEYAQELISKWTREMALKDNIDQEEFIIGKLKEYYKKNADAPTFAMEVDPTNEVIVITGEDKTAFVKDGEIKTVNLPNELYSNAVCTTNGMPVWKDEKIADCGGYYVLVIDSETADNGETLASIYYISFENADRTKVISGIKSAYVVEDKIIYEDKYDIMYCAAFDEDKAILIDEQRISSDIIMLYTAENSSEYIYYLKNLDLDTGECDLYVYSYADDNAEKVASDVSTNVKVSVCGRYVYYMEDVCRDKESLVSYGTLKVYDAKKAESETVAYDVIKHSLTSNLESEDIDPSSFLYETYSHSDSESYFYDVCYYNGKSSVRKAKGLQVKYDD